MERNKKSNRINENKKGDSSLISMVLLIGLSIALSALIFSYSNFEVNKQIQDFTKLKESTQFINLKIKNAEVQDFNSLSLLLQNDGGISAESVLVRLRGTEGSANLVVEGVDAFETKSIVTSFDYNEVGRVNSINIIPISFKDKLIFESSSDATIDIKQVIEDQNCKQDTDTDTVPDCVDDCVGNNCGPSSQCKLISASWSSSLTFGGLPVDLKIESSNCEKNQVDIQIFEKDTLTLDDELDLPLYDISSKLELNSNLVEYKINIPYALDMDGNNANPEYYFTVKLNDQIITSNILEVMDPKLLTINPKISSEKDTFSAFENPVFVFSYIDEEVYYNLKVNESDNGTTLKNKWVDRFDKIDFKVYDSDDILTLEELQITKVRAGKFEIKFNKKTEVKPGKYRLEVELNKNGIIFEVEKEFNWGLIAINTDKSIYLENEKATIGMAVLDRDGRVICDADIILEIIDPLGISTILQGNDIIVSDECEIYGMITKPDYYTFYNVGKVGEYKINMGTVVNGTLLSINDSFFVEDYVNFDVKRNGPTRIYPLLDQFMNISIRTNIDYVGVIQEFVPLDFNISVTNATISHNNDRKIISWDVDLRKGDNVNLYYEFDSPDISPYLYLIGKLQIKGFEERRYWQIAVDIPDRNRVEMVSPTSTVLCDPGQQFQMACRMTWSQGPTPSDVQLRWQYSLDNGQIWNLIPTLTDGLHMLYGFNTVDNAIVNTIYNKDVVCSTPSEYQIRCQAIKQSNLQTWSSAKQIVRVRSVDVIPSQGLIDGVNWVVTQPIVDLGAVGNNGNGATTFYTDIDTLFTNADLYMRATGPLTFGVYTIPLTNEKYNFNFGGDATVPGPLRSSITTSYQPVLLNNPDGRRIYLKLYLDYPGGSNIPPGDYINNLQFMVVPAGSPPP
ncbi:MAG TPA: hypothetical protein VJH20_05770 [Candidatus Nanoarchaeia archaeon]|nr:hypothetical protein [Candidatus Nanoarchaeia archaeon]